MYYIRLIAACAAMLLSWLCFDGAAADTLNTIAAEENAASVQTEIVWETLPAETQDAVIVAVGEGVMFTPMAGRHLDNTPLEQDDIVVMPAAEEEMDAETDASHVVDAAAVTMDSRYSDDPAAVKMLEMQEEMAEFRRAETARRQAEEEARRIAAERAEEARRIAAERAAEQRRIAAEKAAKAAAKEAALRAACPGYDAEFVATLTKEEQAEARYFYEQGYVFYRQNWQSIKDNEYGDCGFGQCGCGPTCIAAIISNLAGVPVDPEEMRVYGLSVGSWLPSGGTTYGFLIETARKYGITTTQIYAGDKAALFEALKDENKLVLATMGPGDFTLGAHFMLFRGMTDEGKILIADSYSFEHSVKEWEYDELYAQLKTGYWIFEKEN